MADWLNISPISGTGNTTITVSALVYNLSGLPRTATVIAVNEKTGSRDILTITQQPVPANTLLDSAGNILLDSAGNLLLSNG